MVASLQVAPPERWFQDTLLTALHCLHLLALSPAGAWGPGGRPGANRGQQDAASTLFCLRL